MCTKFQAPSNQGTSGTPVFGPGGGVCSPPTCGRAGLKTAGGRVAGSNT